MGVASDGKTSGEVLSPKYLAIISKSSSFTDESALSPRIPVGGAATVTTEQ